MREVSDTLLLNMAEVSAAWLGLFMVGVFLFVDTGFRLGDPPGLRRRVRQHLGASACFLDR